MKRLKGVIPILMMLVGIVIFEIVAIWLFEWTGIFRSVVAALVGGAFLSIGQNIEKGIIKSENKAKGSRIDKMNFNFVSVILLFGVVYFTNIYASKHKFTVDQSVNNDLSNKITDSKQEIKSQDWISSVDTIATGSFIVSYKYPKRLHKDFIQNGICFGVQTQEDGEFLNDMTLCVWFNDETLENTDTIVNSEGRQADIVSMSKTELFIDKKKALKIEYVNKAKKVIKEVVLIKDRGLFVQIIGNNFEPTDFEFFIHNFKIL